MELARGGGGWTPTTGSRAGCGAGFPSVITFDRQPDGYRHWRVGVDGRVATLTLEVDEDAGLVPALTGAKDVVEVTRGGSLYQRRQRA